MPQNALLKRPLEAIFVFDDSQQEAGSSGNVTSCYTLLHKSQLFSRAEVSCAEEGEECAPMSTEDGQVVLCTDQLRPGDIVLSTAKKSPISWLIRSVTGSHFSHVGLHVGGGFLVEAVHGGVRKTHGRRFIYGSSRSVRILRRKELKPAQAELIVSWAKGMVYRPYSVAKALLSVLPVRLKGEVGRFCSELVAESYKNAGNPLFGRDQAARIVPGHFTDLVPDVCADITEKATRVFPLASLDRAMRSYAGRLTPYPERTFSMDGETLEQLSLTQSARAMELHDCFRRPYHLIDVLKQLVAQYETAPLAVAAVDKVLANSLEQAGAREGSVKPRESIPGIVSPKMAAAHYLSIWDGGETLEELNEFRSLASDISASRNWDIEDLDQSLGEARSALRATSLGSLSHIVMWLEWEKWYAEQNYRLLGRIANAGHMPIG